MLAIDPMTNPTIFLGSFEWRQPITTLTDMLVAFVCIYAVIQFSRFKGEKPENYKYYKAYFVFFTLSMIASSWLGHGLTAYLGPYWRVVGWVLSSVAHLYLGMASLYQIKSAIQPSFYKIIKGFFFLQFFVFAFLILNPLTTHFIYAQLCSVISLVGLIFPMHIFNYIKTKNKGSLIIVLSIVCGFLPALAFNLKFSVSRWFNFQDISHTLMAGIMLIMYFGVSRIAMGKKAKIS